MIHCYTTMNYFTKLLSSHDLTINNKIIKLRNVNKLQQQKKKIAKDLQ